MDDKTESVQPSEEADQPSHAFSTADAHPTESFCIDNSERANWLVRKVVEARAYRYRVRIWAARELRRSERRERQLMDRFSAQLQQWVTGELSKSGGRRKSIHLPAGVVGFRRLGSRMIVDDPIAVLQWATQNCPAAVVTKHQIRRSILNDHLRLTGELPVKGVTIEPDREDFFIR